MSKFSLFIPDPYKRMVKQSSTGKVTLKHAGKVLPTLIEVIPTGTVSQIIVSNRGKQLVLKGPYIAGQKITFDYSEDEILIKNGSRVILSELQSLSPLEEFWLYNGDTVSATNATISKLEWRDERL